MKRKFICMSGEWVNLDHVVKFYIKRTVHMSGEVYELVAMLPDEFSDGYQVFGTREEAEARLAEIIGEDIV